MDDMIIELIAKYLLTLKGRNAL